MKFFHRWLPISALVIFISACSAGTPVPTPTPPPTPISSLPWIEEPVTFPFGGEQLHGLLTLPNQPGVFPAIVLLSGSANKDTLLRSGSSNSYLTDQARHMVRDGFAVLRYDPPGVGESSGDSRFEALGDRVNEAMAALRYLKTRPDIQPERVGLWGVSQGGWVIGMAAADNPQEVAFIISVSGAGISVADQQVWSVETRSQAAGISETDVLKAALFSRLLIDWQLSSPAYQEANLEAASRLGDGPWQDFSKLVYEPEETTPAESLQAAIKILESIQDEPWAKALELKTLYLPQLRSLTSEILASLQDRTERDLLTDPKDFLPRVTAPMLAVFGENDPLVPAQRSADLFETYLRQAGNQNFKIVVFPNADHALNGAMADYWQTLSDWLAGLYEQ